MHPLLHGATFLLGVAKLAQLPAEGGREIAFAGRSNSGKSSAINVLTGQRGLARTSKTPGRTQLLNYFELDEQRYLVDLPGYGFAKVSASMRRGWKNLIGEYLDQRKSLKGLVIIMDVRRPFTAHDQQLFDWCVEANLPVHILLTKADKFSRGAAAKVLQETRKHIASLDVDVEVTVQLFSALKKTGVDEAQQVLLRWLDEGAHIKKTPVSKD